MLYSLSTKNNLVVFFLIVFGIYAISNIFKLNSVPIIDELYISDVLIRSASIIAVIVAGILLFKNRKGRTSTAWRLFFIGLIFWGVGENLWSYEYQYNPVDPTTYVSDIFWILGYLFIFYFEVLYLKLFKSVITKKQIVCSIGISLIIIIPYIVNDPFTEILDFESAILLSYVIFDVLILAPSVLGVVLFLKGRISNVWNPIFFGIILECIANFMYAVQVSEYSYSAGSYVDMMYVFSYILFAYGIWKNIEIFSVRNLEKQSKTMNNDK